MSSPREVLETNFICPLRETADLSEGALDCLLNQALAELAEIVLKVKELRISDGDDAIDHIANLFTGKEETNG